ncbi:MAG: hypothetical protein R2774_13970 [Saprospiraceae bacterium]
MNSFKQFKTNLGLGLILAVSIYCTVFLIGFDPDTYESQMHFLSNDLESSQVEEPHLPEISFIKSIARAIFFK